MNRSLKPRAGFRTGARALALTVTLAVAVALYAWAIEPNWLEVTHHSVILPVSSPVTVAQISDLHIHRIGPLEEAVIQAVVDEHPDLIVLTGDLYDTEGGKAAAEAFVKRLSAPLGVWYVPGNWEHWTNPQRTDGFLGGDGAKTLFNDGARLREDLWLVGFDDALAGAPQLENGLANVPAGAVTIGLFHSPAFFAHAQSRISLALAGHTHGGQVRVPWWGAPWLPPGSGPYVAGWYDGEASRMYVSRGIGTSILPIRFACRPEVAVFAISDGGFTPGR